MWFVGGMRGTDFVFVFAFALESVTMHFRIFPKRFRPISKPDSSPFPQLYRLLWRITIFITEVQNTRRRDETRQRKENQEDEKRSFLFFNELRTLDHDGNKTRCIRKKLRSATRTGNNKIRFILETFNRPFSLLLLISPTGYCLSAAILKLTWNVSSVCCPKNF